MPQQTAALADFPARPWLTFSEFLPQWLNPQSPDSLRWFIRQNEDVLKEKRAVIRIGERRLGINPERFWRAVDELQQ